MSFLIDEKYLKERTSITSQKDVKDIKRAMLNANEFYLLDLIGIPLFEKFELAVNRPTTGNTLTEKQTFLLNKVKLYNALIVEYDLMFNTIDVTNKGLTDNTTATIELIKENRKEVHSKAERVKSSIEEYLNANKEEFPEYFGSSASGDKGITASYSPIVFLTNERKYVNE